MATYHCSVKYGKCGYAGLHADYIMREGCYAEGPKKEELVYKESGNLPSWAKENPSYFWNCADKYERANGRAYYEFELALPNELSYEQNIALVHEVIAKYIGQDKAYTFAIHDKKATLDPEQNNCHAHIMFCERAQDKYVRSAEKFFSQFIPKYPHRGGAKKDDRFTGKNGKGKETIREIRFGCADIINKHLEMNGFPDVKVDARSIREQKEAALNVGDFKLHAKLEQKERVPHLGPKLAAQYKRAVKFLDPKEIENYFLELSDDKTRQVYIAKAVDKLQKEIEKLEAERALLTSLNNEFVEVKSVADEKLKANDYYSDVRDYSFVDAIFTPKIDEVKQNIRLMSKELREARKSILSYQEIESEAYDILTNGKYSKLENDFSLYNMRKENYDKQRKEFEERKVSDPVSMNFYNLESKRLDELENELKVIFERLTKRDEAIKNYIYSSEGKSNYREIYKLLKDRNSLLYDRIRNARDVVKAGYGVRDELMRERYYNRILHDIRFAARMADRDEQPDRAYYDKAVKAIDDIRSKMYEEYFCTEEAYDKFVSENKDRVEMLDTFRDTYYIEKKESLKQLLSDKEIETLSQSYAVNYHDKNLEKLAEEIKVVTKEYEKEHAVFMKMEKPGWFSFDYRSEYNAKEKEVADLKDKVQKLQKKYNILQKNLEQELADPNVQKRIAAFRQALRDKNESIRNRIDIIEENIKLNMEVKADYVNLGKELEYRYEKHHNEQQTSHALQQIDSLRNKFADKLISDPIVRKEVEDSVDKNIEMLKEQSRVYSRRLFRLQRMLLSEDKIEQLAYNKATDNKEKELSRQKDYIDKLHEEYVQKKEQLKTMLDDDKKDDLVKETEKLERRIYNKQMLYNETCSRYQEKYTDDYVRQRYAAYKKEYADFNSRINEKIAEVTAAKEFNKELRTELATIKREVLRTDYEPQQHIVNNNAPVSQLQRAVSLAKEAKAKKGIVARIFSDDDEMERKKEKDRGLEV